jgi:DNA-directed RNA polymerase subunit F
MRPFILDEEPTNFSKVRNVLKRRLALRRDELRRMAKASTIYAQREVAEAKQLLYAEA